MCQGFFNTTGICKGSLLVRHQNFDHNISDFHEFVSKEQYLLAQESQYDT